MELAAIDKIWEFICMNHANTAWALATLAVEHSECPEALKVVETGKIWELIFMNHTNTA